MKEFEELNELYSSIGEVGSEELDFDMMGTDGFLGKLGALPEDVTSHIDILKKHNAGTEVSVAQADLKGESMQEDMTSMKDILIRTNKLLEGMLSTANKLTDNINGMDDTLKVLNMAHTSGDTVGTAHALEALKKCGTELATIYSKVSDQSAYSDKISSDVAESYAFVKRTEVKLLKEIVNTCVELNLLNAEEASGILHSKDLVENREMLQRITKMLQS